ncbi:NAD(P)H-binding protein [Actinoallomurus sp. NPDC052308]|uniref:NAD(P)H-binding protein n=1 Tax=Actinoallomurus sp. NPDC052308 TaxID=3155530 RepID=UPI00344A4B27
MSSSGDLTLVTGAGGGVGGVGRTVVESLIGRGRAVRAMAHHDDRRADALRGLGADVVVGDLTRPTDVARALDGAHRMFFGMSVSPSYLEAAATVATVARSLGGLEILVDISQMTVSQMDALSSEESRQQRLHWLSEQLLDWSGLPVAHIRPTIFLDNPLFTVLAARSIAERDTIELPFGRGRTSPIAAEDVARVVTAVLDDPGPHIGQVYELTGPRSQDMTGVAEEFSGALRRHISYVDVSPDEWADKVLSRAELGSHVEQHLATMARLHRRHRYDRSTRTVERITGRPAQSIEEFVARHAGIFQRQDE